MSELSDTIGYIVSFLKPVIKHKLFNNFVEEGVNMSDFFQPILQAIPYALVDAVVICSMTWFLEKKGYFQ